MSKDDYFMREPTMAGAFGRPLAIEDALKSARLLRAEIGARRENSPLDIASGVPRTVADQFARDRAAWFADTASKLQRNSSGQGAIAEFLGDREAFSLKAATNRLGTGNSLLDFMKQRQRERASGPFADLMETASRIARADRATISDGFQETLRKQAAMRASFWASNIEAHSSKAVAITLNVPRGIVLELEKLSRAAAGIVAAGDLASMWPSRRKLGQYSDATALKMSTFGGSLDLFGPGASANQAAFSSLFGRWQMRHDLPTAFFRDPAARAQTYRDADVDAGLVDASSAEVVELLVESGAVAGERSNGRTRAIVEFGPLRMTITAGRARHDAYRAIDGFEVALRAFIAAKLAAACEKEGKDPVHWFTARVPGNIVGDAKRIRRDAYKAGEKKQPLINFTNLGDLIAIVTTRNNWVSVFEPVFADLAGFRVDLQRLTAHRRPAMHARPLDGLRLAEILLTIRRLVALMEADGDWDTGWDEDV